MKRKLRICTCCSRFYREWKAQGSEGNTCQKCTMWILRKEVQEFHRAIALLANAMSDENKKILLNMPFYKQRRVILKAIQDNIITESIGRK